MLSRYDMENVDAIISGHGDWFTAKLMRLIAHADLDNREKLRLGFPLEVALYEAWYFKEDV